MILKEEKVIQKDVFIMQQNKYPGEIRMRFPWVF